MAFERSWLSVVEVARESRRRFSGRKEVMMRVDVGDGHEKEADAWENGGLSRSFLEYSELFNMSGPINHDSVAKSPTAQRVLLACFERCRTVKVVWCSYR